MTSVVARLRSLAAKPLPRNVGWAHTLGSLLLFYLALQGITGILLALYYSPSLEHANASLAFVREELFLGLLVFNVHRYGADFVLVVAGLHLLRCFFGATYKAPRQALWCSGLVLLFLLFLFPLTGMLLPYDQKGYWATTVVLNMLADVPMVGDALKDLLTGGAGIGGVTLSRFFILHVCVLPLALVALTGFHLRELQRTGSAGPVTGAAEPYHPFYPGQAARDVLGAAAGVLVLGVVATLGAFEDTGPANPSGDSFVPHPEWYFLPLYGLLRVLPAGWQQLGSFYLPAALCGFGLLLPYLDRGPERRFARRKLLNLGAVALIGTAAVLGSSGAKGLSVQRAATVPAARTDDPVARGRSVFEEMECQSCHLVDGMGEAYGPDLTHVARRVRDDYLEPFLRNPARLYPAAEMSPFDGSNEELQALLAYLRSLE
jgi:ubiquinol-cytochrome c reductase cytochrome b subunit